MDLTQIFYRGSTWSLIVHCTFFGLIQIQDGRQAAILDFESEFVTAISGKVLDGSFLNLICWFPMVPSCALVLFLPIRIQDGRQAAILDFESESLLPLFLGMYGMDLSQILYAGSPWYLVV